MTTELAAHMIYKELRRRIVYAELRPGEDINVADCAVEFGSSRTPVRDALHRLSHDGLVEVLPRARCRVSRVSLKSLVDVLDVREATGPMTSRLAATHALPPQIDELEAIAENGYAGAQSVESILSASHLFHCRVAKVSRNERLHQITEHALEDLDRILRIIGTEPLESTTPLDDHRRLLDAFRARNADEAEEIDRDHIRRARDVTLNLAMSTGALLGD
jgi:DNA-binding GntR family transcriptional regulator